MNNKLIYILLVLTFFASCKKVELDVPVDNPVFSVDATVGGVALDWSAGDDNFYMFTEFSKDSLQVYTLTGRLAKDSNCSTSCEESLAISIRGNAITPSINDFDINQALPLNSNMSFMKMDNPNISTINIYTFQGDLFESSNPSSFTDYSWTINGETMSGQTVSFVDSINAPINLNLDITDSMGCNASFTQSNLSISNPCSLNILVDSNPQIFNFKLTPQVTGLNNFMTVWNNNQIDSTFETDTTLFYNSNELLLNITEQNNPLGCSFDVRICVELDNPSPNGGIIQGVKVPGVSYTVQTDSVQDPISEQLSHVVIEYNDATGLYSSFNGQNTNSMFTITKIEDFEDNENGEKTKKLTVEYDAILYDVQGSGNTKMINGSGVIGIAYPD